MDDKLFNELLAGIGEMKRHRAGKKTTARVHVPDTIDVPAIRNRLGMTQQDFASTFGFAARTLKSWESGERQPEGPARVLLHMIGKDPKTVLRLAAH